MRNECLGKMSRSAQVSLLGFVDGGLKDIRRSTDELDSVGSRISQIVNPASSGFGSCNRIKVAGLTFQIHPKRNVNLNAGGGDLVACALVSLVEHPRHTIVAPDFADRRDAMAHPELVNVFRSGAVLGANMNVGVDEAGQHVHAGEIEFFVTRPNLRAKLVLAAWNLVG